MPSLLVLIHMFFGRWSEMDFSLIVAIFFTLLCLWFCLIMKPFNSYHLLQMLLNHVPLFCVMFHEAIYQDHIVCFTPYWRRSSPASFVAVRSPKFLFTPSLCVPPPTCELWSPPFTRFVFLGRIVICCSTSRLCNCTGAQPSFHTGWYTAITLISPRVTAVVRSVCSLFWYIAIHVLSASPLRMMAVRLEWITTVS